MKLNCEYCNRCRLAADNEQDKLLSEIAYDEDRYLNDIVKKAREETETCLHQKAEEQMKLRLDDLPDDGEENDIEGSIQVDDDDEGGTRPGKPGRREITEEDVKKVLEEYENEGLLSIEDGKVTVTSRGVRKLAADALERILKSLNQRNPGSNPSKQLDFGVDFSPNTRPFEVGDDYYSVDLERTMLNAINRCGSLDLEPGDFEIREEINENKLCAAILIDESGSMRDQGKLEAAMETALALSKLIMREPENTLKVFAFSDKVRQIEPHAIVNEVISGGDTDIKAALAAFRRSSRQEFGDKQVYLITDTEPNNEEGTHLPFRKAAAGLIEEAARYRQEKIGLNIIMLDEGPELKELASTIAKRNLGKVFFTTPSRMGEVIIEDYLKGRKESLS